MTRPATTSKPRVPTPERLEYVKPRLEPHRGWVAVTGLSTPVGPLNTSRS
ncbi:MAG: hypothetical protein HC933_12085 [Pleurocapsa sp. SU_196_0]|nr:hypothetical protein [Pleurocapsa sp. SU_196_0]